jgi:tRNA A37 threonylcarbamoyladenosine biosynthesis protein TsaE
MLAQGPLLIEWPERMENLIPPEHLRLEFETLDEEQRQMRFKSKGKRPDAVLDELRQSIFGTG